jgi:hypothetical protein
MPFARTLPILLMAAAVFRTAAVAAAEPESWSNLRHITRKRTYYVVLRQGGCEHGGLVSSDVNRLVLTSSSGQNLAIPREAVIRFSDSTDADPHNAIYSGRSSWEDARQANPEHGEYLLILDNSGRLRTWAKPLFSPESVSFEGLTLAKSTIRGILYERFTPTTFFWAGYRS